MQAAVGLVAAVGRRLDPANGPAFVRVAARLMVFRAVTSAAVHHAARPDTPTQADLYPDARLGDVSRPKVSPEEQAALVAC